MAEFTPTQGRYLAFIHAYIKLNGIAPAEAEIVKAMAVTPPTVHQMLKRLEQAGFIVRKPGQARSIQILVPEQEIPTWNNPSLPASQAISETPRLNHDVSPDREDATKLYVLTVVLGKRSSRKAISRQIEIRGDQTLEQLHETIFQAYDRYDDHLYEFQIAKNPFSRGGPTYGGGGKSGTASKTRLDDLKLRQSQVFGYLFDFGDNWNHEIQVDRIGSVMQGVKYPRITNRVGKSPEQYLDPDEEE